MVGLVVTTGREGRAVAMPVRRDLKTGSWFFRKTLTTPDGKRRELYGTPGAFGPYQDLAATKVGAQQAEQRAIGEAIHGTPIAQPPPATEEAPTPKTIREHAAVFLENYKPEQKPSERRSKTYALESHLLPVFGDRTIEQLEQTDIDAFARAELKRTVGQLLRHMSGKPASAGWTTS